jgi:hypothetical protein
VKKYSKNGGFKVDLMGLRGFLDREMKKTLLRYSKFLAQ